MTNYQHILLAADYSEQSENVAFKALALAKKYQATLSIVHVLDNIPMPDTSYGSVIPIDQDSGYDLLEQEKTRLVDLARLLHVEAVNQWLIWGVPKVEIIALADQQKVDLIIVGSHGRHGLSLLLGSTANAVLHHAKCDVMAVRLED